MAQPGFTIVRETQHESEAQVILSVLASEGIEAQIDEDDAGDMLPSLEESRGVRVLVASADAARANEILDEYEADNGDDDEGDDSKDEDDAEE